MTISALSFAASCSNSEKKKDEEHKHEAMYQCPMKCEGDKTYAEAGTCPKCNMDLKQTEEKNSDHGHEH